MTSFRPLGVLTLILVAWLPSAPLWAESAPPIMPAATEPRIRNLLVKKQAAHQAAVRHSRALADVLAQLKELEAHSSGVLKEAVTGIRVELEEECQVAKQQELEAATVLQTLGNLMARATTSENRGETPPSVELTAKKSNGRL